MFDTHFHLSNTAGITSLAQPGSLVHGYKVEIATVSMLGLDPWA